MIIGPLQESDGSWSMRRCMALVFAGLAGFLFWTAFHYADKGWWVFIPGGICVVAVIIFLFFTTWNDITELVQAALGTGPKATP